MTKAQTAWAVLTGLFLIGAIVSFTVPTGNETAGAICLGMSISGWLMFTIMIMIDALAVKTDV